MSVVSARPLTSSGVNPKIRSAPGLKYVMFPWLSAERMASFAVTARMRNRSSLARNACSARLCSVRSRVTLANPTSTPRSSRTAVITTSAHKREPSLRTRQFSSSNRPPARAARRAASGLPAATSSGV